MTIQKASVSPFLQSVEGEIAFFRSIMRARPVGIHRYFHVLTIRNAIFRDTGQHVSVDDIWAKLATCYELDALEAIDLDVDTPATIGSPHPDESLVRHPFFKNEYRLPLDSAYDSIASVRRMRTTASPPSSSPPPLDLSPPPLKRTRGNKTGKASKSKLDLAGLVGGDSDSSALTQESGDEGAPATPRDSVVTGTDGGTDYVEEEGSEMPEAPSPALSTTVKPTRGRGRGGKRGGFSGRGRGGSRGVKKKKK